MLRSWNGHPFQSMSIVFRIGRIHLMSFIEPVFADCVDMRKWVKLPMFQLVVCEVKWIVEQNRKHSASVHEKKTRAHSLSLGGHVDVAQKSVHMDRATKMEHYSRINVIINIHAHFSQQKCFVCFEWTLCVWARKMALKLWLRSCELLLWIRECAPNCERSQFMLQIAKSKPQALHMHTISTVLRMTWSAATLTNDTDSHTQTHTHSFKCTHTHNSTHT